MALRFRNHNEFRWILLASLLVLSCEAAEPEDVSGSQKEAQPSPIPAGEDFGAGITLDRVEPFQKILENPEAYTGRTLLTRARVYDVCQRKGCWMVLREGEQDVRVRFEDYGFFVPKNCTGQMAYVEGQVETELVSEELARHYAEEGQRAEESVIRGPRRVSQFMARGVRLLD